MANAYVNLTNFKARVSVTSTTDDTQMKLLIEAVSRIIDRYCNRHFHTKSEIRYFDGDGADNLVVPDILSITKVEMDDDQDGLTWEVELDTTTPDYMLQPYNEYPKWRLQMHSQSDYSAITRGVKTMKITGIWGYGDGQSATPYAASGAVVNTGGITDSATTHALATGKGALFSVGDTIHIGAEQLYVTGVSSDTLTFERGKNGTAAAAHIAADVIYIYLYPEPVREACLVQAGRLWKRKDTFFAQVVTAPEMGSYEVFRGLDPDLKMMLADLVLPKGARK
ncbi:MAG: hypothetical protein WC683_13625 [bacterium]